MMAAVSIAAAYGVIALQARVASSRSVDTPAVSQMRTAQPPTPDWTPAGQAVKGTTGPATPSPVDSQPPRERSEPGGQRAPAPPAPPVARRYSVLVGSFRYEPEAASLLDQLKGLGYRARTSRVSSNERGTWHQVFVGPYGDVEQARQDQARVRQLPGYADAHVVTQ